MNGVKPKKALGQHFLTDMSVARRIAATLDDAGTLPVLEIGPGTGVLTQYLLEGHADVKVVEIDTESVGYLKEHFPALDGRIIEGDFLRMDLDGLFGGGPFCLIGNYPYNISSQIFFRVLEAKDRIPLCSGMLQREVAERLAAKERAVAGVVRRGISLYGERVGVQPAAQGEVGGDTPAAQQPAVASLRRGPVPHGGESHLRPAAQDNTQLRARPSAPGSAPA